MAGFPLGSTVDVCGELKSFAVGEDRDATLGIQVRFADGIGRAKGMGTLTVTAACPFPHWDSRFKKCMTRNNLLPSNNMKHIAAYLLAVLGGNETPSAADVSAILASVGIDADSEQLAKVIAELEGKNIEEVIAQGSTKLASVPAGGAAVAAAGAAAPAAGGAAAAAPEAAKEEEKEESDEDMGFGLFD
ncbi:60s acidic ribosomal protein-domain-containing protein [Catenaria anguillulae PL171]|uniref:60s acidic ribosomal protein-domain-containing protein n=2 Tax=Catenaria anguillulae PL171 TaxID=765915 RepID=A0A1Y2HW77_9FUNG|nr:60s acidic ribosomal protein-domain-containing protein [Catenaria anguillulae PL171]